MKLYLDILGKVLCKVVIAYMLQIRLIMMMLIIQFIKEVVQEIKLM